MTSYCEYCGGAFAPASLRCDNCGAPRRKPKPQLDWSTEPGQVIAYHSYPQFTPVIPQLRKLLVENPKAAGFGVDGDTYSTYYKELVNECRYVNLMHMDAGFQALEFCGRPVFIDPRLPRGAIRILAEGERYDGGSKNAGTRLSSTAAREGSVWAGRLEESRRPR